MFLDILLNHTLKILCIIEERFHRTKHVFCLVKQFLALFARLSLNTTDTRCNRTLGNNLKETYLTCCLGMDTTAELA